MHAAYDQITKDLTLFLTSIDNVLDQHGADNQIYTNLVAFRNKILSMKRNIRIAATTPTRDPNP